MENKQKPKAKAVIPKELQARIREVRKKVRKANARRRKDKRLCKIQPMLCEYSRILAGKRICTAVTPVKKIDDMKNCPKPKGK